MPDDSKTVATSDISGSSDESSGSLYASPSASNIVEVSEGSSPSDGSSSLQVWPPQRVRRTRAPPGSRSSGSSGEFKRKPARRRSPPPWDSPKPSHTRGTPLRRARESEASYRSGSFLGISRHDHRWSPGHSAHPGGPTHPMNPRPGYGSYPPYYQWPAGQTNQPDQLPYSMDPSFGYGIYSPARPFQPNGHRPDGTANSGYVNQTGYPFSSTSHQQNPAPYRPDFIAHARGSDFNAHARSSDFNAHARGSEFKAHGSIPSQQRPIDDSQNWLQVKPVQRHDTSETARLCGSGKRSRFRISLRLGTVSAVDEEMGLGDSNRVLSGAAQHNPEAILPSDLSEIIQTRWIPTDDGTEEVMLTLKDNFHKVNKNDVPNHMRWLHMTSHEPVFEKFKNQIAQLAGLRGSERALITQLLNQVQRREQTFVNGKYIEPMTLRYDGKDPNTYGEGLGNNATFLCFPYFDLRRTSETRYGRDAHAHPTRALLQTKSRLESTTARDENQVITKNEKLGLSSHIHVPQMWALVVNNNLLVTCAPCEASVLRGHSVSTILQSQAMTDEEAWSIQHESLSGNQYFIPVRYCRSWFNLVEQVTKPEFVPSQWSPSHVREDLLSNGLLFKLIDMSDDKIVCENSWPHILRIKRGKSIRILLKENAGPKWPFPSSNESAEPFLEDENATGEDQSDLGISIAADPQTKTRGLSGQDGSQIIFRARELSRSRSESRPPRASAWSVRQRSPIGQNSEVSGSLGVSDNAIVRKQGHPVQEHDEDFEDFEEERIRSSRGSTPRVRFIDKQSHQGSRRQHPIPHLQADSGESRHRDAMAQPQRDSYQSSKHSYAQRLPPSARRESESPLQYPMPLYQIAPYTGAGFYGFTPIGPTLSSVDQKILSSGRCNHLSMDGNRLQDLARTAPTPADLFYTPSNVGGKKWEVAIQRIKSTPERHDKLGNTENQSSLRMITRQSSDMIQDDQFRSDKERCEAWAKICNDVLSDRHEMTYVPEPPDWPCDIHDRQRATRSLKACVCNLRRLYGVLGYQARALRTERMRWHPDRFSICHVSCRKEIQRKAEELYKELGTVFSDGQLKAPERLLSNEKAMDMPTEANPNDDRSLIEGPKLEDHLEDIYRRRLHGRPIQSVSSKVEQSLDSDHQTNGKEREALLLEAHGLPSKTVENDSTKEDDTLPKRGLNPEQNRDDHPLLSANSAVLYQPQASAIDTESLHKSIFVHSKDDAVEERSRITQKGALISPVHDDRRTNSQGRPASPTCGRKADAYEALPGGTRHAYVEEAYEDTVASPSERSRASMSSALSTSNEQEDVTEGTSSEHVTKAHLRLGSVHSSYRSDRGGSLHKSGSEAIETLDKQVKPSDLFEKDELGSPIFMWPLGPVEVSYRSAPKGFPREMSRSFFEQDHDSEGLEAQRHGKSPSEGAPSSATVQARMLNDILDECHNQLQNSKRRMDSGLYSIAAEQDESNVTNTAELLKRKADLNPGREEIDVIFYQQKETVFVLATKLLQAFTPRGHSSVVADKYWGAVDSILVTAQNSAELETLENHLWGFLRITQSIRRGVYDANEPQNVHYRLPKALPIAFRRLVMFFVAFRAMLSSRDYEEHAELDELFEKHARDCRQCLLDGRDQLMLMLFTYDHRDHAGYEAIDPTALLGIMIGNLLDISSSKMKGKFDITQAYSDYTAKIQSIVRRSASVMVYADIASLGEELDAIKSTLDKQSATLWDFKHNLDVPHGSSHLVITVLDRMIGQLQQQREDFSELQHQAEAARDRAAQSISLKTESNNKAILVFTTVTIIFLPLSFVTSYLGMNTADVRNTSSTQGLFWAMGLPISLTVLGLAWMVAYSVELKALTASFKGLWGSKRGAKLE